MISAYTQRCIDRLDALIAAYHAVGSEKRIRQPRQVPSDPRLAQHLRDHGVPVPLTDVYYIKNHDPQLAIRMVQALRDIAPGTAYSNQLDQEDLTVLFNKVAALAEDIKAGFYTPANAQQTIGELLKPETPPRAERG